MDQHEPGAPGGALSAVAQPGAPARSAIGSATVSGLAWLMVQSLTTRITAVASQLVLAWLLLPADFGVIGLAYTVSSLVSTVVNFGIDDVLLQRQRSLRWWSSAAVWLSLGLGLLGMTLLLLAAPLAEHVYRVPKLGGLIVLLAVSLPINALGIVPVVVLRARLKFRFLAAWGAFELIALQGLAILLAAQGCGAYSFAVPVPLLALLRVVVFWRVAPTRVRRRIRPRQARYLVGNGTLVFGNRVVTELVGQGDYITLGIMATQDVVGIYYFAFRLAAQPVRMLAGNFQSVVFPAFVHMNGNPGRQNAAAVHAALSLAYLVMPLCFLQAAMADPLLRLFFGEKWLGAIPLVQILSLGLPFDAISWIAGALLHARGEFRRSFVLALVAAVPFFAFVAAGAWWASATGVAIGVASFYILVPLIYTWHIFRSYGIATREIAHIYGGPTLIAGAAIGAATFLARSGTWLHGPVPQIVSLAVLGPSLYLLTLSLFDRPALLQLLQRLGVNRFRAKRRLPA